MSPPLKRAHLLHVGDDIPLRTSRSAILSAAFQVIDCTSRNAWSAFLAHPKVTAVLFCGSIKKEIQEALIKRIRAKSPNIVIFQMGDADWRTPTSTHQLDPHAPQDLVSDILSVLAGHRRLPTRAHGQSSSRTAT